MASKSLPVCLAMLVSLALTEALMFIIFLFTYNGHNYCLTRALIYGIIMVLTRQILANSESFLIFESLRFR